MAWKYWEACRTISLSLKIKLRQPPTLFGVRFCGWRLTWALPTGCREAQTFWGGWRQGLGGQLRVAHFIQRWVSSWRLWGGGWEAGQNWSIHNLRMGSGASCCTCKGLAAGGKPESGALFTSDWRDGPRGDFCLRHRAAIPCTRAAGQLGSSGGWKVSDTKGHYMDVREIPPQLRHKSFLREGALCKDLVQCLYYMCDLTYTFMF